MAGENKDLVDTYLPPVVALTAAAIITQRLHAGARKGEPWQPKVLSEGTFPPAFITLVGAWASYEMILLAEEHPGGLMAWLPGMMVAVLVGFVAYRGQRAASGGSLGLKTLVPIFLGGLAAIASVLTLEEEPELTKEQIKAAKKAARKGVKQVVKKVGVTLGLNRDYVSENMHLVLAASVVVIMITGLINGHGPFPKQMKSGPFPWCFMVVIGVISCIAFYHDITALDGASFDDVINGLFVAAFAGCMSNVGWRMQS